MRCSPGSRSQGATLCPDVVSITLLVTLLMRWHPAQAGDVSWLTEVTTPPTLTTEPTADTIAPLLVDANGRSITTRMEWEEQRRSLLESWQAFLGPMPLPRPPVALEILKTDSLELFERQLVRYEGEPGSFVEGYLLVPRSVAGSPAARPAIVALHATTAATIEGIAGSQRPRRGANRPHAGRARIRGVLSALFSLARRADFDHAVQHFRTSPSQFAWHGQDALRRHARRRCARVAALRGQTPLGAVGHSLGAKETLYLAAFDERIKAAVASEGGLTFASTNWDAPWYLGAAIQDASFQLNHHQLLALIAPRPFLVLGGETGPGAADGDRSWALISAAQPVWQLYGEPVRLGLYNHRQGHALSPESFARLAEWLAVYLDLDVDPTTTKDMP